MFASSFPFLGDFNSQRDANCSSWIHFKSFPKLNIIYNKEWGECVSQDSGARERRKAENPKPSIRAYAFHMSSQIQLFA